MLSNKRGISLTSNICKLFERILNNRVKKRIKFTEAQAGGREGRSCIDQLFILKSVVNQFQHDQKPVYSAFVDLEKAYDKVWPSSIFHILWDSGIKGKMWRVMKKLNSDLTTSILTKYGYTRHIKIMQGIRQGGVLSVPEFAILIDHLEHDLKDSELGIQYGPLLISSLLLMDDIVLLSDSPEGLQQMLNILNKFVTRWHLVINPKKSKVLIFNKQKTSKVAPNNSWSVGEINIQEESTYKYLGEHLTSNLGMERHVTSRKQQLQSMLNLSLGIAGESPLDKVEMQSLLQFHQKCITPGLLYGCQTWLETPAEIEELQHTSIRRYLKLPVSTPKIALTGETGNFSLTSQVCKQQLTYLWKLLNAEGTLAHWVLNTQLTHFNNNNSSWISNIKQILVTYNITYTLPQIRLTKKKKWAQIVWRKISETENSEYLKASKTFSKLKYVNTTKKAIKTEWYMNLPRNDASIIFRLRNRMLPLKSNMKGVNNDVACPRCQIGIDNEIHLMEECTGVSQQQDKYSIRSYEEVFNETTPINRLKEISNFIRECLNLKY